MENEMGESYEKENVCKGNGSPGNTMDLEWNKGQPLSNHEAGKGGGGAGENVI